MQVDIADTFVPFTQWKPFYTMTFVDYEFTIRDKDIIFDERIMPQQLNVKEGDKFTVKIDQFGRVLLIKE
jgi:hypothetical protein